MGAGSCRERVCVRSTAARSRLSGPLVKKFATRAAFRRRTKNKWGLIGAPARNGKRTDTRNSIAYARSDFSLVKRTSIPMTYFHGNRVNIPLVKLESRTNAKQFWILNTHNPADTHGGAGKWRAESVRRELKRIHRLRSKGNTVLFT